MSSHLDHPPTSASPAAVDPVCGMTVDAASAPENRRHVDRNYSFCGKSCADAFDADPSRYATGPVAPAET